MEARSVLHGPSPRSLCNSVHISCLNLFEKSKSKSKSKSKRIVVQEIPRQTLYSLGSDTLIFAHLLSKLRDSKRRTQ